MMFSCQNMHVGGTVVIPDSFMNNKAEGTIIATTFVGINVIYNEGKFNQQIAFYSFDWLNQLYGNKTDPCDVTGVDDMNDSIPF